ncbi:MAG: UvrD-helicase domain-containing protein [Coriobacteriia bacterium]|nr:UvrD-helicase domain-containing protein [Coriobacteriia bacterium]
MPEINREKIKHNLDTNIFVEAGAGSGKTTVLVDRMVNMVKSGIPIEKICAITFTKAAAGEFYERFQEELAKAECFEALSNIDHCFMGTIDSFCNMVLSEHPMEAGIPASSETSLDEDLREAYSRIFAELRRRGGDDKLTRFLHYNWNAADIFADGIGSLLDLRNTQVSVPVIDCSLEAYVAVFKDDVLRLVNELSGPAHDVVKTKCLDDLNVIVNNIDALNSDWDENFDDVTRALSALNKMELDHKSEPENIVTNISQFFKQHTTPAGKETYWEIDKADGLLAPLLAKIDSFKCGVALDYMASVADIVAEALKREGILSFFDYQIYLRDLLRDDIAHNDGKLVDYIYKRHSYFLIDEFQDTNPIQAEIFFYLTSRVRDVDWTKCIPHPGSLFIVGDPKQSIYRFRNADVSSYLNVAKLFDKEQVGERLPLIRNFRSTDTICHVFNDMFTKLLPKDTANQRAFSPIPDKGRNVKSRISGAFTYNIEYKSQAYRSDDAPTVAKLIAGLTNSEFEYKDIMVIVRKKNHLKNYMKALSELGIPFDLRGYCMTDECPALYATSTIFSAVADPSDKKAMYAATQLSGVKITEQDIKDFALAVEAMPPASVFSKILEDFQIFNYLGSLYAEYVYFALELLRASGIASLTDAASYIADIAARETGEEVCPQLSAGSNRVLLANLHKVKGLQAPVVILADPYKIDEKNATPTSRSDYSSNPANSYMFNIGGMQTTEFADEQAAEADALKAEEIRLLYVAATRAKQALIMCNTTEEQSKNPWWPLIESCQHKDILSVLEVENVALDKPESLSGSEFYKQTKFITDTSKHAPTYHIKRPSDEERIPDITTVMTPTNKEDAALIGTMVHKLMEVLVSSEFKVNVDAAIKEVTSSFNAQEYEGALKQAVLKLEDLKAKLKGAECYCELPFCYVDGTDVYNGIMDLVYFKDNKWHIIDYKTDADSTTLSKYTGQLKAYEQAFKKLTGFDVNAEVCHIPIQ